MHNPSWVPLIISDLNLVDRGGEVALRFRLAPTPSPDWEELFEEVVRDHVPGPRRIAFEPSSPAISDGTVACKIAIEDLAGAPLQMLELVDETNRQFAAILHVRAVLAAYQLDRARKRRYAAAEQVLEGA